MSTPEANSKITDDHLGRIAAVYVRQSTYVQLQNNTASTARQYNMANVARRYGWADGRINIIDKDQGLSGATIDRREGFQEMMAEIILGRIGAVFAVEASRLARDSADWQQLVKLCMHTNTLIIDETGVHDPRAFDDKLLLDVKGLFSALEDYIIKSRLYGAALTRAREGKLRFSLPPGYVHSSTGEIVIDPNRRIQKRVRLLFEQFEALGSALAVAKYFRSRNILFPTKYLNGASRAKLRMMPLTHARVIKILHHPIYAGMYVYGRRTTVVKPVRDGETILLKRCTVTLGRDEWQVAFRGAHEAYITEEQYERTQLRLAANCYLQNREGEGTPREGSALLQGIVRCGVCGSKLCMRYQGRKNEPYYQCINRRRYDHVGRCVSAPASRVDPAVKERLLEALAPVRVEASIGVLEQIEVTARREVEFARSRVKEAKAQAARAEDRYSQAEGENRRVRLKLEGEWEQALAELEEAQRALAAHESFRPEALRPEEKESLLKLVGELPQLWDGQNTDWQDRKELLRVMVREVRLLRVPGFVKATIRWEGGGQCEVEVPYSNYPESHSTDPAAIEVIRSLAPTCTDREIADRLNEQGLRPLHARRFSAYTVVSLRIGNGIRNGNTRKQPFGFTGQREDGRFTMTALAAAVGRSRASVDKWCKREKVDIIRPSRYGPRWVKVTEEEIERMKRSILPRRSKYFRQAASAS